jgi:protein tyrosine/serine phosphatase
LLPHAHQLIEDLGQRDEDTTQLEAIYAEAQDNWQEDHYFYDEAKPRLEKIIGAVEHFDEIKAIFAQASECIETLKEKGDTRNENICRAYYSNAESTWEECDYQATQSTLNNIITKCPEPTFLTILGLILLPALLRCNRSNHRTGTTCECLQ